MNKKRKMVNQSNQQEYTRKRQNTGEDASGIHTVTTVFLILHQRRRHEQMLLK
jgi:hypothetical protein